MEELKPSEKAVERALKNANNCGLRRSCVRCEWVNVCTSVYVKKLEEGRL